MGVVLLKNIELLKFTLPPSMFDAVFFFSVPSSIFILDPGILNEELPSISIDEFCEPKLIPE